MSTPIAALDESISDLDDEELLGSDEELEQELARFDTSAGLHLQSLRMSNSGSGGFTGAGEDDDDLLGDDDDDLQNLLARIPGVGAGRRNSRNAERTRRRHQRMVLKAQRERFYTRMQLLAVLLGLLLAVPLVLVGLDEGLLDRTELSLLVAPGLVVGMWAMYLLGKACTCSPKRSSLFLELEEYEASAASASAPASASAAVAADEAWSLNKREWVTIASRVLVPPYLALSVFSPAWLVSLVLSACFFLIVTQLVVSKHEIKDALVRRGHYGVVVPSSTEHVDRFVSFSYCTAYLAHCMSWTLGWLTILMWRSMMSSWNDTMSDSEHLWSWRAILLLVVAQTLRFIIQALIINKFFVSLSQTSFNVMIYSLASGMGGNFFWVIRLCGSLGVVRSMASTTLFSAVWLYVGAVLAKRTYLSSHDDPPLWRALLRPLGLSLAATFLFRFSLAYMSCMEGFEYHYTELVVQLSTLVMAGLLFHKVKNVAKAVMIDSAIGDVDSQLSSSASTSSV